MKKNIASTIVKVVPEKKKAKMVYSTNRPQVQTIEFTRFGKNKSNKSVSALLRAIEGDEDLICNAAFTLNGAITPALTGSAMLDWFAMGGSFRGKPENQITDLFSKAYAESKPLAARSAFYFRDVRGGQGERDTFKYCLKWLANNDLATLKKNLRFVPYFGRWDDLFCLFRTPAVKAMMTLVNNQLVDDLNSEKPSLLAKWMPSENASSQEGKWQAREFAEFFGIRPRDYRRMLSHLRAKIKLVETAMCQGNWTGIQYDKIPSRAGKVYRKAFKRHDEARYTEFLGQVKRGEKKINASTLYPYDIVSTILRGSSDETLEVMWASLPNYIETAGNRLVVVDTSGSMESCLKDKLRPIDVSVSLGLYFAERNVGKFKDYFITFSSAPTLQKLEGSNITEKVRNLSRAAWGMNTDLQAVFNLVLSEAVRAKVPKSEMPTEIFIISDMQFDACVQNRGKSNFQTIREKYKRAGYEMPKLIFWQVNSYVGNGYPVEKDENGTAIVSGFSPSILRTLLGSKLVTPYDTMLEVLNAERYQVIGA